MKLSEHWLRKWIDPAATMADISERLVMGGLELEIEPALPELPRGVVVARILETAPHPNAERLRVCSVDAGESAPRSIVCGAANARPGLLAPCALPGAVLPGGLRIETGALRGVDSAGMLCSAKELGLAEKSGGLMELSATAVPGTPIERYLDLDDHILHLELTPNRGDCLSVLGLAREIAALYDLPPLRPSAAPVAAQIERGLPLAIENSADCLRFCGRWIEGMDPAASTPDWMRERLRRSGLRSIHPVVDITNYVMLELGQPMHAYDADKIEGGLTARRARRGERLQLLNEQEVDLGDELVIADARGPVGLAGIMGGLASSVSAGTTRAYFEAAAFSMASVAGIGRRHQLNSDALYRYERGVDPRLPSIAMERATALALEICGGRPGPVSVAGADWVPRPVGLRLSRLCELLGVELPAATVEALLARLDITLERSGPGAWRALCPSHRHDLALEADVIEEVARLYGYDRIPAPAYAAALPASRPSEGRRTLAQIKTLLAARGWNEVVNLAFDDASTQFLLDPQTVPCAVDNPITETAALLRSTLWSGLLRSWRHNRARQQTRARLFEAGNCFWRGAEAPVEVPMLAGLVAGMVVPEQWGQPARAADFFDLKVEVETLSQGLPQALDFRPAAHPALHPGQSAAILIGERRVGWAGRLHPRLLAALDLDTAPLLFTIEQSAVLELRLPRYRAVAEQPSSRRDLAVLAAQDLTAAALRAVAVEAGGEALQRAFVFDEYRGHGLPEGRKSLALGLIFQGRSRTLTVEEVDAAVHAVVSALQQRLGATIRG